ncbi:polyketide cyclase [Streptomyces tateyamensis]|uniref:Polyketide cyclase n=1 Tax=Streptomyces tateyamensis TaxID=565073 RepID=A0A2V4P589_9ACTN|nr:nuclear transport factor 2 family protein [Streptomyces tateyamensis]PYC85056.1 polyketide cyclase [Streptomyces tateyamensis]
MTNLQQLAEQYLATWNATDADERRKLVEEFWAADASYTDPLVEAVGRDAVHATIGAVQTQFPGLVFTLGAAGVDAHHNLARFTWELAPAGAAEALVIGFDVLVADEAGRIAAVHGFLDKVPAA